MKHRDMNYFGVRYVACKWCGHRYDPAALQKHQELMHNAKEAQS